MHKTHFLKTWPEFYKKVEKDIKPFEIRKNDRNYQPGDLVVLQEWNPATKEYTGEQMSFQIGAMIDSEFGLMSGYCAFALLPFPRLLTRRARGRAESSRQKTLVLENGAETPICDDMDHDISFDCGYRFCPYCGEALRPAISADTEPAARR